MTDTPPPGPDDHVVVSDAQVRDSFEGVLDALAESIDTLDLASLTWTALALAERAQQWAAQTVSTADDSETRRYLSAEGALFDVTGRAISVDRGQFGFLAEAFARGFEIDADAEAEG